MGEKQTSMLALSTSLETKGLWIQIPLLRLQCKYDNLRLPCTACSQKGLDCGVEDKVLASASKTIDMGNQSQVTNARNLDLGEDVEEVRARIRSTCTTFLATTISPPLTDSTWNFTGAQVQHSK